MSLRAEVWARPGAASFVKIAADPLTAGLSGTVRMSGTGDGTLTVSDVEGVQALAALLLTVDDVTPANSTRALVRVFNDADLVHEWRVDTVIPPQDSAVPVWEIVGRDLNAALGDAEVYPYDWDGTVDFTSADPDWRYGGTNKIRNGSLEDAPRAIANFGFEDGTLEPWWPGALDGVSATAVVQTVTVDTGTYAARVTPLLAEGGLSTTFRVVAGKAYTVTARIRGVNLASYQIGASGPPSIVAGAGTTVVEVAANPAGQTVEVQKTFTGSAAFATVTLPFTAGGDQTSTQLSIRAVTASGDFYVDEVSVAGFGVGVDPWQATTGTTLFEASSTQASSGTWSLKLTSPYGEGGYQSITGVVPGVTYTATVKVGFASVASVWALEVRDVNGGLLGVTSATIGIAAFSTLTVTFVAPDFIPGSSGEVRFRIINYDAASRTAYVDEAAFYQGQAPASIGKILGDLYDDAVTDHSAVRVVWEDEAVPGTPWLTRDFTDSLDSSGAAWDTSTLSMTIKRGRSYLQTMGEANRLGYEWRIVPHASNVGEWMWQVYNPAGMGTDLSTDDWIGIRAGRDVFRGALRRYVPPATAVTVEGGGQLFSLRESATAITALGRLESYSPNRDLLALTDTGAEADELLARNLVDGVSVAPVLHPGPADPQPLVDYAPADVIYVDDPPDVSGEARRVVAVGYATTPAGGDEYTPQLSSESFVGQAAVYQAVRQLLEQADVIRREDPESLGAVEAVTGGGTIPWLVAASDSDPLYRDAAAYVCTGTADHLTIQQAFTDLGSGATVVLAPGSYLVDEIGGGYSITVPTNGTLTNMGGGFDWVGIYPVANWTTGLGVIATALNATIEGLSIVTGTGTKGVVVPSTAHATRIRRCYIETNDSNPIHCQGADNLLIEGVYLFESSSSAACIKLDSGSHQARITQSRTFEGVSGIEVTASDQLLIDHCFVSTPHEDGILYTSTTTGGWGIIIEANTVNDAVTNNVAGRAAIRLVGPTGGDPPTPPGTERFGPQILGNYLYQTGGTDGHGIHITDMETPIIAGNQIHDTARHGIILVDVDRGNISGNVVAFAGEGADVSYDGIHLDSDSNDNYVHGNTVIDRITGNRARYGIRINSADCDDNIIVGNDIRASGGTADYSDAGTGTINTYPAGAAGDNFV